MSLKLSRTAWLGLRYAVKNFGDATWASQLVHPGSTALSGTTSAVSSCLRRVFVRPQSVYSRSYSHDSAAVWQRHFSGVAKLYTAGLYSQTSFSAQLAGLRVPHSALRLLNAGAAWQATAALCKGAVRHRVTAKAAMEAAMHDLLHSAKVEAQMQQWRRSMGELHTAMLARARERAVAFSSFLRLPAALEQPTHALRLMLLNAMNTAGNNLPTMLALFAAQLFASPSSWAAKCDAAYAVNHAPSVPVMPAIMLTEDPSRAARWAAAYHGAWALLLNWVRIVQLTALFTPVVLLAPICCSAPDHRLRAMWLALLRRTLEFAGPAFIKWGQWAATRQDLFAGDMCDELSLLHSSAPAHEYAFTQRTIEAAFGVPCGELFETLSTNAVASGSIGQVHRATLTRAAAEAAGFLPGTAVAVKVRHPGVSEVMQRDFALMMSLARWCSAIPIMKRMRLEETLAQFAAPLTEQLDLSLEAHHLWRFNYNFRSAHDVRFPVPLYPWVSEEVLVETFEEGEHVSRYMQVEGDSRRRRRLAELGSQGLLKMMLVDNFIHSDLHPGNILVRFKLPEGWFLHRTAELLDKVAPKAASRMRTAWREPCIVLLDVGMATQLSNDDRVNMMSLFKAFANMDGRAVARAILQFAGERQTCPDPQGFEVAMASHFEELEGAAGWSSSKYENGTEAMTASLDMVRQYEVNLPGHICAVVVTTLVLEGWSSKLDPNHSVMSHVHQLVSLDSGALTYQAFKQRVDGVVDYLMGSSDASSA